MSEQLLSSEPSGVLGIDYTYRMATSLHALMTGIASKTLSSNGVIPKGTFPYGNFDTIDTDGRIPRVGSEKYKEWVGAAIKSGFMRIVDKVDEIPDFEKGVNLFGSEEKAGFQTPTENSVQGVMSGAKEGIRGEIYAPRDAQHVMCFMGMMVNMKAMIQQSKTLKPVRIRCDIVSPQPFLPPSVPIAIHGGEE